MPYWIHKQIYQNALDEAARGGLTLCIDCGLCSFVCPSKIDMATQFREAREILRREAAEAGP